MLEELASNGLMMVVLSMATAAIDMTVSKASIFEGFREWVEKRSDWFSEMIGCPYCLSHWVAFGMVALYQPVLLRCVLAKVHWGFVVVDLFVSAMAIVMMASYFSGLIYRSVKQME